MRTLLIDADLLAYQAAAAHERRYDWGDGVTSVAADESAARDYADEKIEGFMRRLNAKDVVIALSDDFRSFRKELVDPTYKAKRDETVRPQHLYDLKDYLRSTYETHEAPLLEADDIMGILATDPARADERIIVSNDKDMMTIPGKLFRPPVSLKGRIVKKALMMDITPIEAIRFHFWQTLVGDTTDGYPGLYGVGPGSDYALDVIEAETEEEAWDTVLAAYGSKGLSEDDAVRQARLARILQHGEYVDGRINLWLPPAWEDEALDALTCASALQDFDPLGVN